jgi:hypothetical protein
VSLLSCAVGEGKSALNITLELFLSFSLSHFPQQYLYSCLRLIIVFHPLLLQPYDLLSTVASTSIPAHPSTNPVSYSAGLYDLYTRCYIVQAYFPAGQLTIQQTAGAELQLQARVASVSFENALHPLNSTP